MWTGLNWIDDEYGDTVDWVVRYCSFNVILSSLSLLPMCLSLGSLIVPKPRYVEG